MSAAISRSVDPLHPEVIGGFRGNSPMVGGAGRRHARKVDLVDPTLSDVASDRPTAPRRRRRFLWVAVGMAVAAGMLLVGDDIGGWWAGLSRDTGHP